MTSLRNVAIVGFYQLPIVACDEHETGVEMLYSAVTRTLAECGATRDDFDYQIGGSCDYIDKGQPFGFVAALDVMGSWPPRQDSHLEMDAGFSTYYGWVKIQAEEADTVMIVGYGKNSEAEPNRMLNLQLDPFYQSPIGLDGMSTAALQASAYLARTGATERDMAEIAARNRNAGVRNPDAQVREPATAEELMRTDWEVKPLRRGYVPPNGESAVCLLLAAEEKAARFCDRPVWIQGLDTRVELQSLGSRDLTRSVSTTLATKQALAMAGLASANDVGLIEMLTTNPVEEMIVREAMGLPPTGNTGPVINPSGGPLCGHPILMTGLIRLGEAFRQLSGRAGERAVSGAQRALVHVSQGLCLQQNLVFVLGKERRWQ
jgi:acetyl-CoA acetyltransferase